MSITICHAPLNAERHDEYRAFLQSAGLRDEGDSDIIAWMDDDEGRLAACGSLAGHTLKQFAVAPSMEGTGVMAQIMTRLIEEAYAAGTTRLFLCTKPKNRDLLASLGFYPLVSIEDAVLMENRRSGLEKFLAKVKADASEQMRLLCPNSDPVCGAVVCNCDPFTLGHRHLMEYAADCCDFLYVFAVAEPGSMFTPEERLAMIKAGTADIANCRVYSSELYLVSRATFPAYFIRDEKHADEVRADLDITLFCQRIAPALGITKRFAGDEPFSPTTRAYNERMKTLLPESGMEFIEIPRLELGGAAGNGEEAVSASRVRELILTGDLEAARALVPDTTYDVILKKFRWEK